MSDAASPADPASGTVPVPGRSSSPRLPPALWPQVSALFDEALAQPPGAREAWLRNQDVAHPDAAPHLRRMLAAHDTAITLAPADGPLLAAALDAARAAPQAGQRVGIYRLIEPLGAGGMASVWAAEQTQGVLRRVALKLPHPGLEAPAAMALRFEQERDLLAALEHPHIARLYDAGITPDGQPFLAMELIQGQPITVHAATLPLPARLQLFQQVLAAVSFAHGRLVIHRDLKPSNILVTAEGQVKLLDFGIARLLSQPDVAPTGLSGLSGQAFTPDCAAPEQLARQPLGVTADVYALGVVLFELLSGQRPYRLDRSSARPLHEQLSERLAAAQAPKPSAVAAALHRRELAGDLDAIVTRAMAADPAQRYPSAEALAADLRRHAQHWPVHARPAGAGLRAWRLVQRHRLPVAAGLAVVLALSGGLGTALWQAREARQQAARAQAVQGFLVQVFRSSNPEVARGRDVTAKALLDQGARRLSRELQDQPAVRAALHGEIGGIYITLGDMVQALQQLDQAVALYTQLGQLDSDEAIEAQFRRFEVYKETTRYAQAREAAQQVEARARRVHGPQHRWFLAMQENLAWMLVQEGDAAAAVDLLDRARATAPSRSDPAHLLKLRSVRGSALLDLGRLPEAMDVLRGVIEDSRTVPAYEFTDVLVDRYNLARVRYNLGEHAAVAAELAALLPELDRHIGPQHDRTIKARALWALSESQQGHHARAAEIQRSNLAHTQARAEPDDEQLGLQRLTLATLLRAAGRYAEGLPLAVQGLAGYMQAYPQPTWLRERARWIVGELLLGLGRVDEAVAHHEQALAHAAGLPGRERNAYYADLLLSLALARHQQGAAGGRAAPALAAQAHALFASQRGEDSPPARRAALVQAWLAALQNAGDAAAAARFEQLAGAWSRQNPLAAGEVDLLRAEWLQARGQTAAAQAARARGAQVWQHELGVPWPGRVNTVH